MRVVVFLLLSCGVPLLAPIRAAHAQVRVALALTPHHETAPAVESGTLSVSLEGVPTRSALLEIYTSGSASRPVVRTGKVTTPLRLVEGTYDIRLIWRSQGRYRGVWRRAAYVHAGAQTRLAITR